MNEPMDPIMHYAMLIGASPMALAMLSDPDTPPWMRVSGMSGKCYMVGDAVVHVKPDCRCPRRKW